MSSPAPVDSAEIAVARQLHVRSARTRVRDIATGSIHRLRARIDVRSVEGGLEFHETGAWEDGRRTSNILRWSVEQGAIVLLHHRHRSPVALVRLVEQAPGRWESQCAHLCAQDRYIASLRISDRGVALRWRISGPAKNMTILTLYR